jgi:hypothetical protein
MFIKSFYVALYIGNIVPIGIVVLTLTSGPITTTGAIIVHSYTDIQLL